MKKKKIVIISIILILIISVIGLLFILSKNKKQEKDTYTTINFKNYQFSLNDKYQYEFLKDKNYGVLKKKDFISSYIYISDIKYSSAISKLSTYRNYSSDEVDSNIDELKCGDMKCLVNVKKVHYDDVDKDYNVVIFLIKLDEERTFIFQYEIALNDDTEKIFDDIKKSLINIELVK